MFEPKTVHEMVTPMLMANAIVGMGNWSSNRGKFLNIAYSLICLVTYCVVIKLSIEHMGAHYLPKITTLGNYTFYGIFYANICLTICLIPCGWLRKKYMKAAVMRIAMCEKSLEQMGLEKNYRKFYRNQLIALIFVAVIFVVFIVVNYGGMFVENTPSYVKVIITFAFNYPVGLLYVSDVSFLHWVSYAKTRFTQLNNLLRLMLTTTPDSPQHKRVLKMKDEWDKSFVASTQEDSKSKDNTDTMRAVKQVHLELIKSTRCTNDAFGIQILFSMTVSFVFITSLLYYAYKIFWQGKYSPNEYQKEIIPVLSWILFYSSKVLVINHMCAMASIRDFTLQLIQNPLTFTACGFFNLDHTFIHGVIGSVTTYLVILIQVGDLPTGNERPPNTTIQPFVESNITMTDAFTTITSP
ncbi:PREDICTED: putative gustatory receptor 28a [Trachymyrmex septentrionalis]|uniref:putative gustatory receptor 28a n=1 Tax=Trachymyrmex septentrionalis TaxID=34720 RepID=UPI00084EEF3D|nr:PREDICTED: putative gustatory receptor 28a [Trachymyrmex septentrionalis]